MPAMDAVPINSFDSQGVVLELIYQLKVRDVMSKTLITAAPDATLRTIQRLMAKNKVSAVPIVAGPAMVGLVSLYDIILALDIGYIEEMAEKRMTKNVIVLEDEMPLSFAIQYFNKYGHGRFPVLSRDMELVGIITPSDVLRALLLEINCEIRKLEETVKPADSADGRIKRTAFKTVKYDFENAGNASASIKKQLKELGVDAQAVRRATIASYELELNQIIHSIGGMMTFAVGNGEIEIVAKDEGPGIPDVELAMTEGYSTAIDWIRSLGFGAGMGLANTKRAADDFSIDSGAGRGTTVRVCIKYSLSKEGARS
jgi:CBS domain-containing protein/anti-sigma regulatory factor (Ser/Thr protein kinase)